MAIHLPNLNGMKHKELLILIICLLIGLALRFYTLDQKSFWVDEVHTFNDSRDAFKAQIKFYKENPAYLHPPQYSSNNLISFMATHAANSRSPPLFCMYINTCVPTSQGTHIKLHSKKNIKGEINGR